MARDYAERVTTRAADGVELSAGVVRPAAEPRAVVLAGHAMMVDARSLDRPAGEGLATTLAAHGLLTVAADFRGHGYSGTPAARGGRWTYDDLIRRDFPALLALARGLAPDLPCFVLGHSLMGHVAAAAIGLQPDTPVRALVAVSSGLWMKDRETHPYRRLRKAVDIAALDGLTRLFGYFPSRRVGMGPCDESAGYIRQLIDTYHGSRWSSADGSVDYRAALVALRMPVLAVVGRGETYWCTPESVRSFFLPVPQHRFTLWHVGRGDHGLTRDPGHIDILTDPRNRPLWDALADWMIARI